MFIKGLPTSMINFLRLSGKAAFAKKVLTYLYFLKITRQESTSMLAALYSTILYEKCKLANMFKMTMLTGMIFTVRVMFCYYLCIKSM